jgi:hypothetical protein
VPRKRKKPPQAAEVIGFLGVGLDEAEGHRRITQSEHFLLVGGSQSTHERMQETAVRFEEGLELEGRPLSDLPLPVLLELFRRARKG